MSGLLSSPPAQYGQYSHGDVTPTGPSPKFDQDIPPPPPVEAMFAQIMFAVQKSNAEIAELRSETADLRAANAALERQVRETVFRSIPSLTTPSSSIPPSPSLAGIHSPFLAPTAPPSIYVPSSTSLLTPGAIRSRGALSKFYAVVPAGGAGTRLWPLSREGCPKFLLDLTQNGRSLIQSTWDRLLPLSSPSRLMVVTGRVHAPAVQDQLPDLLPVNIFPEPSPKESAAAIGLAAAVLAKRDPEAILGSFAADHMISGTEAFISAVCEAVATAQSDYLVTIGIAPSSPATGFGYIRLGQKLSVDGAPNARLVSQFKEKPDARTAAAYLSTGNYRWNAGMFVVKARVLMDLLAENEPALHAGLQEIAESWDPRPGEVLAEAEARRKEVLGRVWETLPKIAIDNAVAEPAAAKGQVAVVPSTFGWDDLGDFSSLAALLPAEKNHPVILGDQNLVVHEQVVGGIVVPLSKRVIACLGVDDLVIVDTPDALLVTTRARSQDLKKLVQKCRETGWKQVL